MRRRPEAGRKGSIRVAGMIPHSKVIELPQEVGDHGDVTDFFVRVGRGRDEFLQFMAQAEPVPHLRYFSSSAKGLKSAQNRSPEYLD
jgi:hypothetical protein